jgi:aspartyl-tRNA(Asn)/glutamyl-tRNA(Gln) amidotransferase subunit C
MESEDLARVSISLDDVRHIAGLARLEIEESSLERYRDQLREILDCFRVIEELESDPGGAGGSLPAGSATPRPDSPRDCVRPEEALANAPETDSGLFRIPGVRDR